MVYENVYVPQRSRVNSPATILVPGFIFTSALLFFQKKKKKKKKGEKGEKNSPLEKPPIILNASAKHRLRALSRNAIVCRAPSFLLFSPVLLRYIAITRSFCLREKHRQGKAKNKR